MEKKERQGRRAIKRDKVFGGDNFKQSEKNFDFALKKMLTGKDRKVAKEFIQNGKMRYGPLYKLISEAGRLKRDDKIVSGDKSGNKKTIEQEYDEAYPDAVMGGL